MSGGPAAGPLETLQPVLTWCGCDHMILRSRPTPGEVPHHCHSLPPGAPLESHAQACHGRTCDTEPGHTLPGTALLLLQDWHSHAVAGGAERGLPAESQERKGPTSGVA